MNIVTAFNVYPGAKVKRGPGWHQGDHDHNAIYGVVASDARGKTSTVKVYWLDKDNNVRRQESYTVCTHTTPTEEDLENAVLAFYDDFEDCDLKQASLFGEQEPIQTKDINLNWNNVLEYSIDILADVKNGVISLDKGMEKLFSLKKEETIKK